MSKISQIKKGKPNSHFSLLFWNYKSISIIINFTSNYLINEMLFHSILYEYLSHTAIF